MPIIYHMRTHLSNSIVKLGMLEVTQQDEFFAALQNKLTDFSDYLSIVFIEFFD